MLRTNVGSHLNFELVINSYRTYNTGLMKCCAFGKADNEKHLVEVDFSCPEGSTEIDWEVHGVQLDHEMMDMNMMEMMGFNLMGPLDF